MSARQQCVHVTLVSHQFQKVSVPVQCSNPAEYAHYIELDSRTVVRHYCERHHPATAARLATP